MHILFGILVVLVIVGVYAHLHDGFGFNPKDGFKHLIAIVMIIAGLFMLFAAWAWNSQNNDIEYCKTHLCGFQDCQQSRSCHVAPADYDLRDENQHDH